MALTEQLERADRQIAEARQRIADQRAQIVNDFREGIDVTRSRQVLRVFEQTLAQMIAHRERVKRDLQQI
jgi:hypothetical protein